MKPFLPVDEVENPDFGMERRDACGRALWCLYNNLPYESFQQHAKTAGCGVALDPPLFAEDDQFVLKLFD